MGEHAGEQPTDTHPGETPPAKVPVLRALFGGGPMGLANLVPGISGGTMLVATGVYRAFIEAVAEVTRLRFRAPSLVLLAAIVVGAGVSIVGLAGVITTLLTESRWAMYSLFIGLTLGGVPLLWKLSESKSIAHWAGVIAGFVAMAALVVVQGSEAGGGSGDAGFVMLLIGGAAGASAMILPGVSGAFLLLILGLYETIVGAVKDFAHAGFSMDFGAAFDAGKVLLPVGLGVLAGIAGVSTAVRFMLRKFPAFTIGSLLGLLLASPLGLYPFRDAIPPRVGDTIDGQTVTEETLADFLEDPKDWPERSFTPSALQVAGSLGLIGLGFGATLLIARLDKGEAPKADETPSQVTGG